MLKDLDSIQKERLYVAILTGVQFFNILDFVVLLPLGPALMRYFEISPGQFSVLASSYSFSAGVTGIFYSTVADKYDRKKLLLIMLFFFIISTLLCALAPNFEMLLLARIFAGVFGGIITPVAYAILTDLIPFERRGKAMGTLLATFSITSILGIPTGLAISDIWGWRHTFHFIGIGATIILLISYKVLPQLPLKKSILTPFENIKRLWSIFIDRRFTTSYITIFLFTASGFLLFPFLSPYAVKNIGIQETDLKLIYFIGGIFTVFSSKFAGVLTDRYGSLKVFIPSTLISLPFIYLYTSVGNTPLSLLLIISTGFMLLINFRFVPIMTLITKSPDADTRGSFMGVLHSIRSFTSGIATAFTGFIVYENKNGLLINFGNMGLLSIGLSLVGMLCFFKLYTTHTKEALNE
jgi:predicted MFS family arabinose efflux permease